MKKEITISVLIMALAVLLLNPMDFWMPDMVVMFMLAFALVLFALFASFVLKEKAFDERDIVNRSLAGRNAFLSGSAVLMLGIVWQGYSHTVDPWLVVSLVVMIIVKIGTRFRSDKDL